MISAEGSPARVEAAVQALQRRFPPDTGMQYTFVREGQEPLAVCRGLADRGRAEPVTPRTTFHCLSTTKPITALAVLRLVARGQVELDAPLARYVEGLPYPSGATVRQVLSHQAGLPNPLPLAWVHRDAEHATFDGAAFLARILREHPKAKPPGRKAAYSNIGYLLLGRLIELVSGVPYAEFVQREILSAIPQADDGYLGFDLPAGRHAVGYTPQLSALGLFLALLPDPARLREREGVYIRYRPFHLDGAAYGGLKGNALGWLPLLQAIARRDERLLPAPLYDSWFATQALASGAPSGVALAWFTGQLGGYRFVCHAGGGPGYGSEIRVYPELHAASVLMLNTTLVRDTRSLDVADVHVLT
ncbi:MAG: serine hydrolase domain-containing protein [Polyangia bacterium]